MLISTWPYENGKNVDEVQMQAPPVTTPPAAPPAAPVTIGVDTAAVKDWTLGALTSVWLLIPLAFAIFFSAGAAYLSYQRNQSVLWAILDFFFSTLYYPYYAFFLSTSPAPAPTAAFMGAARRIVKRK